MTSTYVNKLEKSTPRNTLHVCRQQGNFAAFLRCLHHLVLIFIKCHLFNNFIFFCSNNMLFINHALKLKYQPSRSKVNVHIS